MPGKATHAIKPLILIALHLVRVAVHFPRKPSFKTVPPCGSLCSKEALRLWQDFLTMSDFLFHLELLASLPLREVLQILQVVLRDAKSRVWEEQKHDLLTLTPSRNQQPAPSIGGAQHKDGIASRHEAAPEGQEVSQFVPQSKNRSNPTPKGCNS